MVQLMHLFFADDVFLFCHADRSSVSMLKRGLDIFSYWSGLFPNKNKSEVFFSGGDSSIRNRIFWAFGFQEGKLPVRYLGVPIISSRLSKADCTTLTERITARIQSWEHCFLSFAGRMQLIRSMLHSIQSFWASVFSIPSSVLSSIEQIMRQLLWKGTALGRGGAKVAWDDVYQPKVEGGLGIRNLKDCNRALCSNSYGSFSQTKNRCGADGFTPFSCLKITSGLFLNLGLVLGRGRKYSSLEITSELRSCGKLEMGCRCLYGMITGFHVALLMALFLPLSGTVCGS